MLKKLFGTILVFCLTLFPIVASASEEINLENYTSLGLKEVLEEESIEAKFDSYEETDDQINVYLFRGNGCTYCRSFLEFLNTIASDEYGKYFKLVSFETWYDENNYHLLESLSEFMGSAAQGVPYIIIGDQVFPGYASDYDEAIKAAITDLYNSEDRYDVIEAYNENLKAEEKAKNANTNKIIIFNLVFLTAATVVVVIFINRAKNAILVALENNKTTNVIVKKEETEEVKEKTASPKKKPYKKVNKTKNK